METQKSNLKSTSNCEESHIPLTTDICRICLESVKELDILITLCHCRGSIGKVHKECLEAWLVRSDTNYCEICKFQYKVRRNKRYSLLASVKAWFSDRESQDDIKQLVSDGWQLLIVAPLLIFLSCAGIYLANQIFIGDIQVVNEITYRFVSLCLFTTVICTDVVAILIISNRIQCHIRNWFDFYKNNHEVIIIDPNLPEDTL